MVLSRSLNCLAVLTVITSVLATPASYEKRDVDITVLEDYDYIVVGSGAGGGPLAARLAIYGQKVLLLEAGDDEGTTPYESIPALYPAASEYAPMSWDFFSRHYPNDTREGLNLKATYETPEGTTYIGLDPPAGSTLKGIWYPRAATLGGCATHNAMITMYPFEEDWSLIQNLTGDASWAPENMVQYWQRIERNEYLLNTTNATALGHGFDGWLGTSEMPLSLVEADPQMLAMLNATNTVINGPPVSDLSDESQLESIFPLDMNTLYPDRDATQSLYRLPAAVSDGVRSSPRNFLLATANATFADGTRMYHLDIRTHALVTKIRFSEFTSGDEPRAIGVDFLDGESLYSADPRSGNSTGTPGAVNATKEVIISAGTFNTPQLLKLSGVGPRDELESFNISVVADLPGVGANLLDHYEISTVVEFNTSFALLEDCTWLSTADDPCYIQYTTNATDRGPYATTLVPAAALLKSSIAAGRRDTFVFGGPFNFRGYFQGYAELAVADTFHWTWSILKAHENDFAGTVTLKSTNPLDTPNIDFNFFDAGTTAGGADELDIRPLVEAIQWTRDIYGNLSSTYQDFVEDQPGASVTSTDEIKDYIKNQAWGHHAMGTARMKNSSDPTAVVDSHFRVWGIQGLRIVDASIFPQMPGFFPITSVYMIGEKAADVIVADNA
ncbi:putative GMC oxidoreductase [Mollisia scopiformis]|uniref:Putative GMC oxidoreductase n=1 Tax=Mollisia scopiformis TaxID=149040 RepID=A0A132B9L0_MOLSC|nr:putative GMC oxidoreductase [Mollisia scopiformis]KUJ09085.1 putative GMC oxidoreductase [Mollisia scopiformis]